MSYYLWMPKSAGKTGCRVLAFHAFVSWWFSGTLHSHHMLCHEWIKLFPKRQLIQILRFQNYSCQLSILILRTFWRQIQFWKVHRGLKQPPLVSRVTKQNKTKQPDTTGVRQQLSLMASCWRIQVDYRSVTRHVYPSLWMELLLDQMLYVN